MKRFIGDVHHNCTLHYSVICITENTIRCVWFILGIYIIHKYIWCISYTSSAKLLEPKKNKNNVVHLSNSGLQIEENTADTAVNDKYIVYTRCYSSLSDLDLPPVKSSSSNLITSSQALDPPPWCPPTWPQSVLLVGFPLRKEKRASPSLIWARFLWNLIMSERFLIRGRYRSPQSRYENEQNVMGVLCWLVAANTLVVCSLSNSTLFICWGRLICS